MISKRTGASRAATASRGRWALAVLALLLCAGCHSGGRPSGGDREENRVDDRWMDVHRFGMGSDPDR